MVNASKGMPFGDETHLSLTSRLHRGATDFIIATKTISFHPDALR